MLDTNSYKKIIEFLNAIFNLKEAIIFDEHGEILSKMRSRENRLSLFIPHFLKALKSSQINESLDQFFALVAGNGEHKIILVYLKEFNLYISMHGNGDINLSLFQLYLPEISKQFKKTDS